MKLELACQDRDWDKRRFEQQAKLTAKQIVDFLKEHNMERPYHSDRLELSGKDWQELLEASK